MSKRPIILTKTYKSGLEDTIAATLSQAGITFDYEKLKVKYEVPARTATYVTDFTPHETNIVIEGKGHFGVGATFNGRFSDMTKKSTEARQKFILVKAQHPELDIRFVFSKASAPIYKGSPTTHAQWAADHGFRWADKTVPQKWLEEILEQQRKKA